MHLKIHPRPFWIKKKRKGFDYKNYFAEPYRQVALLANPAVLSLELSPDTTLSDKYTTRRRALSLLGPIGGAGAAGTPRPPRPVPPKYVSAPSSPVEAPLGQPPAITPGPTVAQPKTLEVVLQLDNRGAGITFRGPKNDDAAEHDGYGVFVTAVQRNTVAGASGSIFPGMQLLKLNGVDLSTRGTTARLKLGLATAPSVMAMTLAVDPATDFRAQDQQLRASSSDPNLSLRSDPDRTKTSDGSSGRSSESTALQCATITVALCVDSRGTGLKFGGAKNEDEGRR